MSVIKEKYKNIGIDIEYLLDSVILSQAWKKSHTYMRRHNWYADVLELDISTLDLENNVNKWAEELEDENFHTSDIKVVLAPKSHEWEFKEESTDLIDFDLWTHVYKEDKELELRPLAHIGIRDQTFATALMICLADMIETKQGRTDQTDFLLAQNQGVYNYGNRLQCIWEEGKDGEQKAKFSWGNSATYRQYFEDYRLFLQRPIQICQHYSSIASPENKLFIVSLDIGKFFDCIDRNALVSVLQKLSKESGVEDNDQTERFWEKAKRILTWEWSESSEPDLQNLSIKLPKGLPQGLVASGFLANAYMIYFDKKMGEVEKLKKQLDDSGENYFIRDYCRYVDDIRIVVETTGKIPADTIKQNITDLVNHLLREHENELGAENRLMVNEKKTKVESFEKLSSQKSISSVMEMTQNTLSGTPDIEGIRQAFGSLEGLLKLSEQFEEIESKKKNRLALSSIASSLMDVSDDTIKRFAGKRMLQALRMERGRTNLSEVVKDSNNLEKLSRGEILDHEFEVAARKLIYYWAKNPSLTPLLKYGLNMFPDRKLIGPVLEVLQVKLSLQVDRDFPEKSKEIKITEYIASDLLFASTTYLGYDDKSLYPDSADVQGFRAELGTFARWILANKPFPWYLVQSAVLYLISIGDYSFIINDIEEELTSYRLLQDSAKYQLKVEANHTDRLATALIIQQIKPDAGKFINWFIDWIMKIESKENRKKLYLTLFNNRPDLLRKVYNFIKESYLLKSKVSLEQEIDFHIKSFLDNSTGDELKLIKDKPISLLKIIQSDSNPFSQENGLLLLIKAIFNEEEKAKKNLSKGLMVADIAVICKDWEDIQNPDGRASLEVEFSAITEERGEQFPPWIEEGNKWLYALGRIIRACVTGEHDYTASNYFIREDVGRYRGIRSTPFSRSFGLNNSSAGLLKEPSPLTPWLNSIIIAMLQWPGILRGDIPYEKNIEIQSIKQLLKIIKDRLKYQSQIYGDLSDTPTYILPVNMHKNRKNDQLRVALVQTLLPKVEDFNDKAPSSWSPEFRNNHRNHLASICHLITSHLKTRCSAENSDEDQNIDLIIFPELSIHPDDIVLLERLSDQTKANIFAGLTFLPHSKEKNKYMNQAFWLLRDERFSGRKFTYVHQGKGNMTAGEEAMNIKGYRPYQVVVEFQRGIQKIRIAGAICYDATDLSLAADLRDVSDIFVVSAMNKDIQTFDNMVAALQYHMYQPVILANSGEYGGSTAQAPFIKHDNLIAHLHGNQQVGVSIFDVDATAFKRKKVKKKRHKQVKTHPAGYVGRDW